jgi:hypothetical protein
MIDPFEEPERFIQLLTEGFARAVKEAIAENDRRGIPSCGGENGRVVWGLRGQRVPPPDWAED